MKAVTAKSETQRDAFPPIEDITKEIRANAEDGGTKQNGDNNDGENTPQSGGGIPLGWLLIGATILMLVSATFDTTATKAMNRVFLPPCDGCEPRYFEAPMFQTFTGYVGQSIFLIIHLLDRSVAKCKQRAPKLSSLIAAADFGKPRSPAWIWVFPLALDFASTACLNYSTMLAQASTVQMLRSSNIIVAFALSAFALKNRIYIHQILAVGMVFLGLILISVYALMHPDTETNYGNMQWAGIVTAIAGTMLSALQWVVEEFLFRRYRASPVEAVGWMGAYGVIVGLLAIAVAQATGLEDVKAAIYQMSLGGKESHSLIALNVSYLVSLSINTASGLAITQLASSLLRTIVNAARTVSIWLIEMALGWSTFNILNFVALLIIIFAMFVYNYNYFIRRRDHWAGDHYLRSSARCLPNKYDVSRKISHGYLAPQSSTQGSDASNRSLHKLDLANEEFVSIAVRDRDGSTGPKRPK